MNLKLNILFILISFSSCGKDWSDDKTREKWHYDAIRNIENILHRRLNGRIAKNIILFLGDGMGISTVTAGRILKGQLKGNNGEEEITFMESLNHVGLSKTYNIDAQVPDSAATATAYLSGVKARFASLGLDGEAVDCKSSSKSKVDSVLKWAHYAGKSTGIVTTTRVTHATPAAAYAHAINRETESFDGISFNATHAELGCKDIAAQLVEDNSFINLVMGGGRKKFLNGLNFKLNETYAESGDRVDGRNLVNEWTAKMSNEKKRCKFVWNRTGFDQLRPNEHDHVLALLAPSHLPYELDRNKNEFPDIVEMTEKAIELLSVNPNGFFLLVEGGRIDHGHHESMAQKSLHDFVVFDNAVGQALSQTDEEETLITVTADHSHVFTLGGYGARGSDLFGVTNSLWENFTDSGLTYTPLLYGNGPGFVNNRTYNLTNEQTRKKSYRQESAVLMKSETHGGEDVAIYANGPMAYLFDGTFEQSYIAHVMAYSACIGPYNSTNYPDCEVERGILANLAIRSSLFNFNLLFISIVLNYIILIN